MRRIEAIRRTSLLLCFGHAGDDIMMKCFELIQLHKYTKITFVESTLLLGHLQVLALARSLPCPVEQVVHRAFFQPY